MGLKPQYRTFLDLVRYDMKKNMKTFSDFPALSLAFAMLVGAIAFAPASAEVDPRPALIPIQAVPKWPGPVAQDRNNPLRSAGPEGPFSRPPHRRAPPVSSRQCGESRPGPQCEVDYGGAEKIPTR